MRRTLRRNSNGRWKVGTALVVVLLAAFLGMAGCGEETPTDPVPPPDPPPPPTDPDPAPPPPGGPDPNVFCNENKCARDPALKQQCVNTYNTCIANNPDVNDDECVASALANCWF